MIRFLKTVWRLLFWSKIDRINHKLSKSAKEAVSDRKKLRDTITAYVLKAYGFGMKSEYIPHAGINREKVYLDVQERYGLVMKQNNLRINRKLQWR